MNLSEHFTLEEATFSQTAVRKGIDNTPTSQQIEQMITTAYAMEEVRHALNNKPIRVSSWFRSRDLNAAVGGSANSAHLDGYAVDFTCAGFGTPLEVCRRLARSGIRFDQLIEEGTWVHISFRPPLRGKVMTAVFSNGKVAYAEGLS